MQFNLVSTQAAQGNDQEGARWLEDLARALTSRGGRVDWWMVSSERLDVPSSGSRDSKFTAHHEPDVDAGGASALGCEEAQLLVVSEGAERHAVLLGQLADRPGHVAILA